MSYIKARLGEASTWRAIAWCISAFGIYEFTDSQEGAITALAMAASGAGGLLPDNLRRLPTRPKPDNN